MMVASSGFATSSEDDFVGRLPQRGGCALVPTCSAGRERDADGIPEGSIDDTRLGDVDKTSESAACGYHLIMDGDAEHKRRRRKQDQFQSDVSCRHRRKESGLEHATSILRKCCICCSLSRGNRENQQLYEVVDCSIIHSTSYSGVRSVTFDYPGMIMLAAEVFCR